MKHNFLLGILALVLAASLGQAAKPEIQHVMIEPATEDTPRSDTAAIAPLADGRLMVVYNKFHKTKEAGRDHGLCTIWSKLSADNGRTWDTPRMLVDSAEGDMNVQAPAILAEECARIVDAQGTPGSVVFTTSANAIVAKKGSVAYDASKAAANHLVRSLAVTLAPGIRVNAVAPATVIEGSTMFPRERVLASLAKYDLEHDHSMTDEELVGILGAFYAGRNLLNAVISPRDQYRAIRWLLGPEASCTTGQVLHVDGGLADGFLR